MFSEFLETLRAHTRMDQDVDTKTVIDLNRVERTMKTKSGTKLANKLSNHLRLLVTFLVIAWLFCSKRRILQPAGCQKHFIHPHNIYLTAREHLILGQRQALADQLLRSHHRSQSFSHQGSFLRPVSDRRNSQPQVQQPSTEIPVRSSPSPSPPPSPTATSSNENGKMLVCYYTTRQSGPFLSRGSREFVIPVDSQPPLDNLGQQQQQQTGGGNNQFAPLFPYEPYFLAANGVPLAQAIQAQQVAYGDLGNANMAKNQQQQLIFKSLSSLGGMMPIVSANRVAAEPAATNSNSSNNGANDGKLKQQYLANQKTISQMLSLVPALDLTTQTHATMQTTSAGGSSTGRTTNKQMPVYSFIGDPETNNGLIVGQQLSSSSSIDVGGVTTAGPTTTTTTTSSTRNGNNRNGGFFPGKDTGVVNNGANQPAVGHQLDRNSMELMKQSLHQQLVFAPSLNRAFALGGMSVANNADPADTKLPNYQAARPNSQLAYNQQQLRLKNGNLLEQQVFAGAVSSAPPVPLSPASSLHQYQQPQQTYSRGILPNANQVVFSSAGTLTTKKSNGAKPIGLLAEESPDGKAALAIGASSPDAASSPTSAMDSPPQPAQASVGLPAPLVSSPLSTMFDVFGAASQYLMRFKPSSFISPSSFAFNSIPTDHQRLNHHHHKLHLQHQSNINQRLNGHHHVQNHALKSINSSLLDAIASAPSSSLPASPVPSSGSSVSSAASSLLSLPFSPSGILASIHKSSSSVASSNDRSSNGSHSMASGILSRLASQNNQRREDVCGKTIHTPQRRIIGGEGARYGEFPYQVHIKIAKHQCGGALIDRQSIVTAAHCVYHFITRAPVSKLQIVIGAYDIEDEQYQELPPQYFKVNKVKLHPNFRFSASHPDRYDIAILKLDKPVKYTDNVMPVCLPSKDLKFESMVGTVTGFGKTDPSLSNRYGTRLLQKVDVPIIENNECERWHRTRGIDLKIFPEMMCAGYEDGLKDACVGDSGGPLVVKSAPGPDGSFRWTLAGITSAGFGCAQSRQPGIYHRVSHTVDWILENLD